MKYFTLVMTCIILFMSYSGALPGKAQSVDFEMVLNDGGFVSFDPFHAEMAFRNPGSELEDARLFAILEIAGQFYFWPDYTTQFQYEIVDIVEGDLAVRVLSFTFPDIQDFIPFGPMFLWGAWFHGPDNRGIDVAEFWLDYEHKWTPTPPPSTPTPFADPGALYATDAIVGNLRCVPSGSFLQGSPETEPCRSANETQFVHQLSRNLAVMETEVTENMWEMLRAVQPSLPEYVYWGPGSTYPVRWVTWHLAILYANLLSDYSGFDPCYFSDPQMTIPIDTDNYLGGDYYCDFDAPGYRLPTEGEWEYTCRAGTTGAFSCDEPAYNESNCQSCDPSTHPVLEQYCVYCAFSYQLPVASLLPNPWNFYDMHGNSFEWCWDWIGPYPDYAMDYSGSVTGFYRVARSGSAYHEASLARSAFRAGILPQAQLDHVGFRLVRTIH